MPNAYYDVEIKIMTGGFEKSTTNRVLAECEVDAQINAIVAEMHNIDDDTTLEALAKEFEETGVIEDGFDFMYSINSVTKLAEHTVVIDGEEVVMLLPEKLDSLSKLKYCLPNVTA